MTIGENDEAHRDLARHLAEPEADVARPWPPAIVHC
jgi:hypothetical protein